MISQEQKLDAWKWLCQEALAGNSNAVAVLVEWASPPEEDEDPLEHLAATFQWWLDADDRNPGPSNAGITPPILPSLKKMREWANELKIAAGQYTEAENAEYGQALEQMGRCLLLLCKYRGRTIDDAITPPVWPTRAVLESWIKALKSPPAMQVPQ